MNTIPLHSHPPDNSSVIQSLPHAVGPEKAVLSVLMQNPEFWHETGDLSEDWFYTPANRTLYGAMKEVVGGGGTIELVGFAQRLLDSGRMDAVGGLGYLSEIYTYQPSPGYFGEHLEDLRNKAACRLAIKTANDIIAVASTAPDASELLDATSAPVTAIHDLITASKPSPDAKTLGRQWFENYEKLIRGEKLPMGIKTGIFEIDNALRGLHPGMVGVISARSSGGKSTLATQIMCGVASKDTPAIYLPLEGTVDAAYSRCVIQLSGLEAAAITSPKEYAQLNGRERITEKEKEKVASALKKLISGGFHFDPPANRKIPTILSTIRRAHRKHGIVVALIDYVQLIRGERGVSKEQEIMGISNSIQELAAELGIFILLMSQENNDGDTKHARAIEEDSDWTLSVVQGQDKKREDYKEHKYVLVTKDRHNGKGGERLPLVLDRKHVRFVTRVAEETAPATRKDRFGNDY
jgi:replicative DNA helicase